MPGNEDISEGRVAVVDDDSVTRLQLRHAIETGGYEAQVFSSAAAALAWPGLAEMDCVISDVYMPGMSGEDFLEEIRRRGHKVPVIIITGHGDVSLAVRCLKSGAYDFVEKPISSDTLLAGVARAVERSALARKAAALRRRLRDVDSDRLGRFGMVGRSAAMEAVYERIEQVARSDAPALITGETGVGKELVARAIHGQSRRSEGPFIPVNAGALPETMLESELFGHVRGAYTSAGMDRDGKLVTASGGSLLLDEVETLSLSAQIKLLRALDDGVIHPLGTDDFRKTDVRLLATTKETLRDLVRDGRMREDFYHRIMALTVTVPPLRERVEDIPDLAAYFLRLTANRDGLPAPDVSAEALDKMKRHPWPGNVRELKHAMERMVIASADGAAGELEIESPSASPRMLSLPPSGGRLRDALESAEQSVIEASLRENRGEVVATARSLGVSRRALYERMKKYGLRKEDFRG